MEKLGMEGWSGKEQDSVRREQKKVKGWCERNEAPLHPAPTAGYQNSTCLGIKSRRELWGE